ncbi:MAG: HEAT repeat domain-containing protein [Myxococcales bacterium]
MRTVATSLALALPFAAALLSPPAAFAAARPPPPSKDVGPTEFSQAVMYGSRPEVDRAISKLKHLGVTRDKLAPVARLLAEGQVKARQNCAYVFSVIPEPSFADNLEKALEDEDEVVRGYAATALGKIKSRESLKPLAKALGDVSPVVRRESAKALGNVGDKTASRRLVGLLEDPNTEVRIATILALGQLGDPATEKPLLPLLKDSSETMRLAALRALCSVGSPEGKKQVEAMLASSDPLVRKDGIRLLEGLKTPWVRAALLALTRDKEIDVAIAAAKALAMAGDGRGVEWLVYSLARVDLEESVKIEGILEDLQLTAADRKRILAKKPSPELVLPVLEAEKVPPTK